MEMIENPATLVIGYNVEYLETSDLTGMFLKKVQQVHNETGSPCTLYVVAEVVQSHTKQLAAFAENPLFDIQMTTRRPLKTVCQVKDGATTVWRGATLDQIEEEVSRTRGLFKETLGVDAVGISSPLGYYRGLSDRPDVLEVLDRCGVKFCRTYGRNHEDWQPVDFRVEQFWYTHQGFPGVLEFPVQGWQDSLIRPLYGWDETDGYIDYLKGDADEAARRNGCVWSYWAHDWATLREDDDMKVIRSLIDYASEIDLEIETQSGAYRRLREQSQIAGT